MIKFRQKEFSEYDAMRSLYVELMKRADRSKFGVIDLNSLLPILKGNNVVIEKFVISTSVFGKDKYRMYLRIGSKAKMPDEVRLPQRTRDKKLGNMQLNVSSGIFEKDLIEERNWLSNKNKPADKNNNQELNTQPPLVDNEMKKSGVKFNKKQKSFSMVSNSVLLEKTFDKKGPPPFISSNYSPYIDMSYEVKELLGDAIKYDKKERTLVLEFPSIDNAIQALNILPFGLGYKIYLLNP